MSRDLSQSPETAAAIALLEAEAATMFCDGECSLDTAVMLPLAISTRRLADQGAEPQP
jgi:hypothetical protein|tara:strand:+ start:37664 stop:37837 length:174 start_codon:yes stop_codon:yes gene_type:complete